MKNEPLDFARITHTATVEQLSISRERNRLARSLAATRSGLNETRRALKALRASPLNDLGLLLSLRNLAESAAERGKLPLSLSLPEQMLPENSCSKQPVNK